MNDHGPFLTPEVEEILTDIAGDARARLFKIDDPEALRGMFEEDPGVSPSAAGLTPAEEHLLRVHRAEVADVLRKICIRRISEDADGLGLASRSSTAAYQNYRPRRRVERADIRDELVSDAQRLLDACCSRFGERPSLAYLAMTALRLEPGASSRIHLFIDAMNRGRLDHCRRLLTIAHRTVSPDYADRVWDFSGLLSAFERRPDLAHDEFMKAYRMSRNRLTPLMSAFGNALESGDEHRIRRCTSIVDETIKPGDPKLLDYVSSQVDRATIGKLPVVVYAIREGKRGRFRELGESSQQLVRLHV